MQTSPIVKVGEEGYRLLQRESSVRHHHSIRLFGSAPVLYVSGISPDGNTFVDVAKNVYSNSATRVFGGWLVLHETNAEHVTRNTTRL